MDHIDLEIIPSQWDVRVRYYLLCTHIFRSVHSMFLQTKLWADPRKDKKSFALPIVFSLSSFFFPGIRQPRDAHLFKEKYRVLH